MPSPRYHREIPARYRLEAGRCTGCGRVSYPTRKVCPACRGTDLESIRLSPRGTVVTSTVIHVPPDEFLNEAPYAMAVVETPEGARLMTQVVDCDPSTVLPGTDVDLEFRLIRKEGRSGILCYGHKGVPAGA
ncbi:Zn-ribbon domain-containing OB-fold protein [Gemmatimonadota bacterium]